jgi:hypothetical protein
VLSRKVEVGFRDMRGKDESVVVLAPRLPEFLKPFGAQQFSQRVRRIDGAVNHDMDNVNSFWGKFRIERLAEHASPPHGGSMRMLSAISAHRRRR